MLFGKNFCKYLLVTFLWSCIQPSFLIALPSALKKAIQLFDGRELEKAKEQVDQLIKEDKYKHTPSAWYYKGVIYDQLMRNYITSDAAADYLQEAINAYLEAAAMDTSKKQYYYFAQNNLQGLWTYYLNRAVQYYRIEAFEESLEQLEICHKIKKDQPQAVLYTAIIAQQAEKYPTAIAYYEKYKKLENTKPETYWALAELSINDQQDFNEASKIIEEGLKEYPWNLNLLAEKYKILIATNQLENTKNQLNIQLPNSPDEAILHYQLAYLYTRTNEIKKAIHHYQKILQLHPRQIESIVQLGILYYNQGALVLNGTKEIEEEKFQQIGKEILEQATTSLNKSLSYWEKANKITSNKLEILIPLHTLYIKLRKTAKAAFIAERIKEISPTEQLVEIEEGL